MNKLILLITAIVLSVSTCHKKIDNVIDHSILATEDTLTKTQLDSIFIADTLSFDIENDWIQSQTVTPDQTGFLYKYVYIKSLTDTTGVIYTLNTYQDTLFILNKRIMK